MANNYAYKYVPTDQIGSKIDELSTTGKSVRHAHERRWYDNNFFDDGYHFRYLSRTTGKMVDANENSSILPTRAIPKASRQIRGIANLISSLDPVPVCYPSKVSKANYIDEGSYMEALALSKMIAQKSGTWLLQEFKKEEIKKKQVEMLILAAKHGVSFLQIWPDAVDEQLLSKVYDAFDIVLMGNLTSIYDSPFILKEVPELISRIQANENFEESQLALLSADNKLASSEIKQAYMQTQFGKGAEQDQAPTLILKEAFIKEYLNNDNYEDCKKLSEKTGAMDGKKKGDVMIRHTFSAGGVWLMDEYARLDEYPFVDYRYEPGMIYQTPLIERFIPANKSLDIAMSRVERFLNTMVTGTWLARDGEDLKVSTLPGGQIVRYAQTPPTQATSVNVPSSMFEFMTMLERNIEEQGASTSALGKIPSGVKSGVAIESIKATEYDNLRIATDMFKDTTKRIAELMLDFADDHFMQPQTVHMLEQGEPKYFDVIGARGVRARQEIAKSEGDTYQLPDDTIPLSKDTLVDIEIESGQGFTMEGKKETMQQLTTFVMQMAQAGVATTEVVKEMFKKLLETYQFGSTQEFMEAFDIGLSTLPLSKEQIDQMKVAVAETIKDLGMAGPEMEQRLVDSTKLGVAEAIKDLSGINKQPNSTPQVEGQSNAATQY